MYLVDTNIFLEVLLSQSRKEECEKLLEQFKSAKKVGIVTDFTIHSVIVVMSSYDKLDALRVFLSSLKVYKGLKIYQTDVTTELRGS